MNDPGINIITCTKLKNIVQIIGEKNHHYDNITKKKGSKTKVAFVTSDVTPTSEPTHPHSSTSDDKLLIFKFKKRSVF